MASGQIKDMKLNSFSRHFKTWSKSTQATQLKKKRGKKGNIVRSNIKNDIYTTSQSKAQIGGYHSLLQARPKEECAGQRCPSLYRWLFPPWSWSTNTYEYFLFTKCCSLIRSFTIEITNTSVWSLNWPLHPTQWHCPSERHKCCCEGLI